MACALDPIQILPEEIWEEIFDKVEDTKDWLSLYRVSSSFENVIGRKKISALFSEVLEHLATYLDTEDVLECRLVCQKWKLSVDNFCEKQLRQINVCAYSDHPRILLTYEFQSSCAIRKFTEEIKLPHSRNPFAGRRVIFSVNDEVRFESAEKLEEFTSDVIKFLQKFGKDLQVLTIKSQSVDYGSGDEAIGITSWLRSLLYLVPNLEVLSIFCDWCEIPEGQRDEWKVDLEKNSLPKLEKLEKLTVLDTSNDEFLFNAILNLSCCPEKIRQVSGDNILEWVNPSLKNLQVLQTSLTVVTLDSLEEMKWEWPLKTLFLADTEGKLGEAFEIVNRFSETLTELVVEDVMVARDDHKLRMKLPKLKLLKIGRVEGSLDFLGGLVALEKLEINEYTPESSSNGSTKVRLRKSCDEIYKVSIWRMLPSLKIFEIGGDTLFSAESSRKRVFTREGYLHQNIV